MACSNRRVGGLGRSHWRGVSLKDLARLFPDELAAREWLEDARWGTGHQGRFCPHCGSLDTYRVRSVGETSALPLPSAKLHRGL